jgi:hypothetical protein
MVTVSAYIPQDLFAKIAKRAVKEKTSISRAISTLLKDQLVEKTDGQAQSDFPTS